MSSPLQLEALDLDWRLAIKRLRTDIRDDFWPDPLELDDFLSNTEKADRLRGTIASFCPVPALGLQIPKKNLTIRTSLQLRPIDRLVYQALIDRIAPVLDAKLTPASYSHRLGKPDSKWLFRYKVGQWKNFRAAVREALENNQGHFLVATDVSQYYENIDFRALRRQIDHLAGRKISKHRDTIDAIHHCLKIWSPYKTCGLPQNIDASSLLGNVLLDYVDRRMLREGYRYYRYMDDIRVVVATEAEARVALMHLIDFLRDIHLGVNSGKTRIIAPSDDKMCEHMQGDDPEVSQIEDVIQAKNKTAIQEVVPLLLKKTRDLITESKTDERIFRFCVNRLIGLRRYRNLSIPDHEDITTKVLELLPHRPAESDTYCRFLSCSPLSASHKTEVIRLLEAEPLCVYRWQNYHLWRLSTQKKFESEKLLRKAHAVLKLGEMNPEVGAAALYLGACGDYADREAVRRVAATPLSPFLSRCMHLALQELHAADRTPVLKQLAEEGEEAELLSEYIRNLREPVYVPDPPPIQIDDLPEFMPSVY